LKGSDISRRELRKLEYRFEEVALEPHLTDDGSVYWISYENEDLRVTKEKLEIVLEMIDPDQRYKLFTIVGKANGEPLATVTVEEGVSEHRIRGKVIVAGNCSRLG
jgi:hypothetical protein